MNPPVMPIIFAFFTVSTALGWIVGELTNRPILRRVCGPVFTVLLAAIVAAICSIHFTISDSLLYSGATSKFVDAVVRAIDDGRTAEAHEELRKFNDLSGETYEGGAFLRWLREPTERLNSPPPSSSEVSKDDFPADQ